MSKRGNESVPGNSLKFVKSVTRMSQRGSYVKMRCHERLSGGADTKSKSNVNVNKPITDTNPQVTPAASETLRVAPEAEEEIESILVESSNQMERTTGDKKVNEMIDYVIHNLQEAGKALASLGENFEHDLKLMFVDVMGKVQNWVSIAQVRLDSAKTDLDSLRRELVSRSNELASREREITDLRTKLIESEVTKVAYEKALTEQSGGGIQTPSAMTFVPSRQPLPTDGPSSHSVNMAQDPESLSGPQSRAQFGPQSGILSGVQSGTQSGVQSGVPSQGALSGHDGMSVDPGVVASGATVQKSYGAFGATQEEAAYGQSQQTIGMSGAGPRSTTDAAVQSRKSRDRVKRSSDLESELSRLRKENERIMKERTDYENAIQRALLRGVSSLNAETLRVLKCSPVSCYTPCGPPPSPVTTAETLIPCVPKKTRDNWTPRGCRTTTNTTQSRQVSSRPVRSNVIATEQDCFTATRPSTGTCGSFARNKKSPVTSDPSMVFLLHQADGSSVCVPGVNTTKIRPCGRTKSKKLDTSMCVKKLG